MFMYSLILVYVLNGHPVHVQQELNLQSVCQSNLDALAGDAKRAGASLVSARCVRSVQVDR